MIGHPTTVSVPLQLPAGFWTKYLYRPGGTIHADVVAHARGGAWRASTACMWGRTHVELTRCSARRGSPGEPTLHALAGWLARTAGMHVCGV